MDDSEPGGVVGEELALGFREQTAAHWVAERNRMSSHARSAVSASCSAEGSRAQAGAATAAESPAKGVAIAIAL
ncbi:hypothetical protein ABTY96_30755 [Streptomyces sp. NPDC096057]|uniref:hypothetical protein n=1 Tax=Streptomyces sp. NPDC096057 TaxID=3155543 RepID=UPI00332CA659